MTVNTNDVDRLKAEIRYLRNCLLEAYGALPTLPCTSQESWHVASPITRGIREYHTAFDSEFDPSVVARKRRRVSAHLSRSVTPEEIIAGRPNAMPVGESSDLPPKTLGVIVTPPGYDGEDTVTVKINSKFSPSCSSVAKSLGF
jgi:hypothetical protein